MNQNQTPFEYVGPYGKTRKRVNTHRIFFNHILAKKQPFLQELLHRFETQRIVKDIQVKRQKYNTLDKNIRILSRISNDKNPSLYINYFIENKKVFHISIHLCPHVFQKRSNGLIHVIQNTNTVKQGQTTNKKLKTGCMIRINGHPTSTNAILFSIGNNLDKTLDIQYKKETDIIVDVLNAYFDPQNLLYLGRTMKQSTTQINNLYKRIQTSMSSIKRRHTRKNFV